MATVTDVEPGRLISEASKDLKNVPEIQPPEWIAFVKSGAHKQRPSDDPDFWYKRSASILRNLYVKGSSGVSKFRTKYGGKKSRGTKTNKFYKGSGSIIRRVLHQLEGAGLVSKGPKGRIITDKGKSVIDRAAARVVREDGKKQA